jgi:hypothetical protein
VAQKQEASCYGQRRNQVCRSEARLLCAQAERIEEGLRKNVGSFFHTIGSLLWSAAERLDKSTFIEADERHHKALLAVFPRLQTVAGCRVQKPDNSLGAESNRCEGSLAQSPHRRRGTNNGIIGVHV